MTLKSMVWSHDDSALAAQTSKGLLRRARRDLASGLGRVESADDIRAIVVIDDLIVELDAKGLGSSTCTCKAHGVCRHILVAILLLRDRLVEAGDTDDEYDVSNAVTQICSLADEQVVKFAGADWDKAIGLAADNLGITFEDEGVNITVRLAEMNASVTFIADSGLKGAAYKGPKTRKRLLTTLAALAVRQRAGMQVVDSSLTASASPRLSSEFVDQAQKAIERAVSATLPSRSLLAHDLLLDLAISTRCEALPRLSAELRALATLARLANERSVEFEPESFLLEASRAYALLEVLRTTTPDPILGGSIRRDYEKGRQIEVWPLGVSKWRSKTGARGLTAYVLEPASNRWLTVIEGRSAGVDNAFDVSSAYEMPIWGAGTLSGLMGRRVRLPEPGVAYDGSLSARNQSGTEVLKAPLKLDEVFQSHASHSRWETLKSDLASRMGSGIRRRPNPLPALIAPSGFGRLGFDDMSQSFIWELFDEVGDSLVLELPADDDESALRLWRLGKRIPAMVVEARLERQQLEIKPVAVLLRHLGNVSVHNIDFDAWPVEWGLKKAISKLSENLAKPLATSPTISDPIDRVVSDAAEELVSVVNGSKGDRIDSILRRLDACGMSTLSNGLKGVAASGDLRSVLKAGYVASELRAMLALR